MDYLFRCNFSQSYHRSLIQLNSLDFYAHSFFKTKISSSIYIFLDIFENKNYKCENGFTVHPCNVFQILVLGCYYLFKTGLGLSLFCIQKSSSHCPLKALGLLLMWPKTIQKRQTSKIIFFLSSTGQSQNCTGYLSAEYATSARLLQAKWRMFSWLRGVGYCRF